MSILDEHHFIFPGRFQPFHNDHLAVVEKFLRKRRHTTLYVGVVLNFQDSPLPKDDFEVLSTEHFLPERNPFTPHQRLKMITETFQDRLRLGTVLVTLLPKPTRGIVWRLICAMFPGNRTWVIPSSGETWDDYKADFFEQMGDSVVRIRHKPTVDGRRIREALSLGNFKAVQRSVPSAVWSAIGGLYAS